MTSTAIIPQMISFKTHAHTHTHTHPFNGPLSGTTRVSRYQKGKTNLDFTEARDSEWQRHQLGHMQICTLLQTNNHASTPPLSFYRPDALPATQPTVSKYWRQSLLISSSLLRDLAWKLLVKCNPTKTTCHWKLILELNFKIISTTQRTHMQKWPVAKEENCTDRTESVMEKRQLQKV